MRLVTERDMLHEKDYIAKITKAREDEDSMAFQRECRRDSTNLHTAISRKVVGRNAHATIPKGNMEYDQYTVCKDQSCRTYFCCFPLVLANICPWSPGHSFKFL